MRAVSMLDLKGEFVVLQDSVRRAIEGVLDHQWFIGGPEVGQLEERIAVQCNRKFAVAVSSGTDALLCSMMSLGIRHGDEVITTPFSFIATAESIALVGARPVFVDIDPKTYNIDVQKIEQAITEKTKAIMPVNLYCQCVYFDEFNAIAARFNLPLRLIIS